jgi:hypothetical protein
MIQGLGFSILGLGFREAPLVFLVQGLNLRCESRRMSFDRGSLEPCTRFYFKQVLNLYEVRMEPGSDSKQV